MRALLPIVLLSTARAWQARPISRRALSSLVLSGVVLGGRSPAAAQDVRTQNERQYELYVAAMRCESVADLEGAEQTWSRLIEASNSKASKVVLARAYSGRSRVRAGLGKLPPALVDISEAVDLEPDVADFWAQRGAVFEAASKELHRSGEVGKAKALFESAASDYDHGLMLDPRNAALFEKSGDVRVRLGDFEGALQKYMQGLELEPTRTANSALATKFALNVLQTGDDALGARILSEVLALDNSEEILLACAAVAWNAGAYAEGLGLYRSALAKNHTVADVEGVVERLSWPPRALELLSDLRDRKTSFDSLSMATSGYI